jgi:hypothetical protein
VADQQLDSTTARAQYTVDNAGHSMTQLSATHGDHLRPRPAERLDWCTECELRGHRDVRRRRGGFQHYTEQR